jgi:hypothetical protein
MVLPAGKSPLLPALTYDSFRVARSDSLEQRMNLLLSSSSVAHLPVFKVPQTAATTLIHASAVPVTRRPPDNAQPRTDRAPS